MADSTSSASNNGRRSVFQKITSTILGVFGGEDSPEPNFEISAPFNFKHTHHVQADPRTSTGFSVRNYI